MQIYKTRCKHCGKTYWYNTYGNEDDCTDEYCSECAKVLNSIPVKFEPKWKKIENSYLLELFQRIEKSENEKGENNFPCFSPLLITTFGGFNNCVEIHHDGKHYRMYWNDDAPDEKVFYIEMEYDKTTNEFTDEPWVHYEDGGFEDYYYHQHIVKQNFNQEFISVNPMAAPSGLMEWFEPTFQIPKIQKNIGTYKLKHKLRTETRIGNGTYIQDYIKNGRYYCNGKSVVSVKDGIDIDSLMNNMNYEYTVEYYEDNNLQETLTNIRIK